jgi:hypothetical protein
MTIVEALDALLHKTVKIRRINSPKNEYYYLGSHGRIHNQNDEPVNIFAGDLFKDNWEVAE